MIKLAISLFHLFSMLAVCSVAETVTGELNDTSSDSIDPALSLNKLLCSLYLNNGHVYVDCTHNGTF